MHLRCSPLGSERERGCGPAGSGDRGSAGHGDGADDPRDCGNCPRRFLLRDCPGLWTIFEVGRYFPLRWWEGSLRNWGGRYSECDLVILDGRSRAGSRQGSLCSESRPCRVGSPLGGQAGPGGHVRAGAFLREKGGRPQRVGAARAKEAAVHPELASSLLCHVGQTRRPL